MNKKEKYQLIIKNHKGILIKICRVYTNTNEDFEDLFQDILLNIWTSLGSFKNTSKISTWIYKIALNVSIRFKTKQKRQHFFITENNFTECSNSKIEEQESIEHLYKCISKLNKIDKAIISLFLEELPYKVIADIIGISENLVAVKIKRIKTKLYNCLK